MDFKFLVLPFWGELFRSKKDPIWLPPHKETYFGVVH